MATSGLYGPATRVPAIPDARSAKPEDVAAAVKEWIEVREGVRGDGMDKAVTLRDLLNANLATPLDLQNLAPGMAQFPVPPGQQQESATPPTPENLVASGAFKYVTLTWDFARGYSRLAYFEIWRSPTDAIGNAVLIAQPYATIYADGVGPGVKNYYWVRAVSDAGINSPFSSLSGTLGETDIDPSIIIAALQGQIGSSALNDELGDRVSLIDGPNTMPGSVNNRIEQVSSVVGGYTAAIEANTQSIDGIKLQYTMKLDNNGYVAGIGISSDLLPGGNGAYSQIIMRADSFSIGSPSGPGIAPSIPFIVRTTQSVINGVTVPIGVYIQDAMIANGSIGNAKIGNLQVDDAKIANMSVAKLRAGAIVASEYVQSSNYVAGQAGFLIHGNGYAEFQNGVFRGTIYATAGLIGGNVLADNSVTTSKLIVGNMDQVIPDSQMADAAWWGRPANYFFTQGPNTYWHSNRILSFGPGDAYSDTSSLFFPVVRGGVYLFEYQVFVTNDYAGPCAVYFHLPGQEWLQAGVESRGYTFAQAGIPGGADNLVTFDENSVKGTRQPNAIRTINDDANGGRVQVRIITNVTRGVIQFGGFRVTRVMDSTLIQGGAITTDKLAARAVTAEKLLVNTLDAVSRNIGTLDGGITNGQRTVVSSTGVRVFDQNNTMLVELGIY